MKLSGVNLFGGEVTIECTATELKELLDGVPKRLVVKKDVELPADKTLGTIEPDPKKEDAIKAIKDAVAKKKAEKKEYTGVDIVRMYDEENMSMKDIAEKTGIPYSTCWQKYHKVKN